MKILVACEMPDFALEALRAVGGQVLYSPDLSADDLPAAIRDVAILVVHRLRVGAEAIHTGTALQLIIRAGTGVSNIDVDEASSQGVFVSHCPHRDAVSIAEYALGLLVVLDRGLIRSTQESATRGNPEDDALGLHGRTLGIIGGNPAARELACRATAFELKLLAWSPQAHPSATPPRGVELCASRRDLARRSELLVVVANEENDETPLDADLLTSVRDGATVVFVGTPGGMEESAVIAAAGRLRLAIDLTGQDTGRDALRLAARMANHPEVLVTHRLSDRTVHARHSVAGEVVHIVRQYVVSGQFLNCVNLLERSPATWQLVLRLRDAVGVMASIMDAIRADGVNAEEITSRVFVGARAAWCTIALDERPSMEALDAIRELDGVLHLELRAVV